MQKLKPTQLKGNFEKRNLFEGWLHKIYSAEHQTSFVIIYGYSTGHSDDKFGFIQLLTKEKKIYPTILMIFPGTMIMFFGVFPANCAMVLSSAITIS